MTALTAVLTAALVVLGATHASAQFKFSPYEKWTNPDTSPNLKIRRDRWLFGDDSGGLDATREVRLNSAGVPALFMRLRHVGQTTDDEGFTFFPSNSLYFAHPEKLTRVQAKFKISRADMSSHCDANANGTNEIDAAQIFWNVFNDGSSTGPGDGTGDHQVNLRVSRFANRPDPPGVFRVEGRVCRCPDANCNITGPVFPCSGAGGFATVKVGSKFTLQIIHDPSGATNAKFLFGVVGNLTGQPNASFGYPSATPANPAHNQAVSPNGYVQVRAAAVDCTVASGGPKEVDVETQVYVVKTNPEAVIP